MLPPFLFCFDPELLLELCLDLDPDLQEPEPPATSSISARVKTRMMISYKKHGTDFKFLTEPGTYDSFQDCCKRNYQKLFRVMKFIQIFLLYQSGYTLFVEICHINDGFKCCVYSSSWTESTS